MRTIPKRFLDAKPTDWEEGHVFRKVIKLYVSDFETLYSQGKAPAFFGVSGKGKSRAAAALLNTLSEITTPPITTGWYPASETMNRLLDFRDMHMSDSYIQMWNELKTTNIIVLDDISTLRDHPRVLEYFWMIVEARYYDMLPTIFTGNFEGKDIWETLGKWFSDAFSRRVYENSHGLVVLI